MLGFISAMSLYEPLNNELLMISEEDEKFVWEMDALELKINGGRF